MYILYIFWVVASLTAMVDWLTVEVCFTGVCLFVWLCVPQVACDSATQLWVS